MLVICLCLFLKVQKIDTDLSWISNIEYWQFVNLCYYFQSWFPFVVSISREKDKKPFFFKLTHDTNDGIITENPRKLALGLFVGKGLFQNIKLTTFIRPWSYLWGHGPTSGEGLTTLLCSWNTNFWKCTQSSFRIYEYV